MKSECLRHAYNTDKTLRHVRQMELVYMWHTVHDKYTVKIMSHAHLASSYATPRGRQTGKPIPLL